MAGKCKPGKKQALVVVVLDTDDGMDDFMIVQSLGTCGLVTKLKKLLTILVKDFLKQVDGCSVKDFDESDIDDILTEEPFCPSPIANAGFIQVKFLN